jgi:hypothetical protein
MQYAANVRRAIVCRASSHRAAPRKVAFTTPPHCGQCATGAFARRWFRFSQAVAGFVFILKSCCLTIGERYQLSSVATMQKMHTRRLDTRSLGEHADAHGRRPG